MYIYMNGKNKNELVLSPCLRPFSFSKYPRTMSINCSWSRDEMRHFNMKALSALFFCKHVGSNDDIIVVNIMCEIILSHC